jgi:hypothetical protein
MMAGRTLLLWLAAMAFGSGAHARADAPLTYRAIRQMTPAALGRRLLGPERGGDIVRMEFLDLRSFDSRPVRRWPSVVQLALYARPIPLGAAYCSQRLHVVTLSRAGSNQPRPLDARTPLRLIYNDEGGSLARAPGCRLAAGQRFAHTRDPELAMRTLDALASAQTAALSANGTIPFQLACRDDVEDDPDRCASGTREALAHLPLAHACAVDRASKDGPNIDVYLCTDLPQWVLHELISGSDPPRLLMVWKYPDGGY